VLSDGRTIVTFPNGTRKEISADKKNVLIRFFNGDVKKIKPDQKVVRAMSVLQFLRKPNSVIRKQFAHVYPLFQCLWERGGLGQNTGPFVNGAILPLPCTWANETPRQHEEPPAPPPVLNSCLAIVVHN
jgi:hypothetical protein